MVVVTTRPTRCPKDVNTAVTLSYNIEDLTRVFMFFFYFFKRVGGKVIKCVPAEHFISFSQRV